VEVVVVVLAGGVSVDETRVPVEVPGAGAMTAGAEEPFVRLIEPVHELAPASVNPAGPAEASMAPTNEPPMTRALIATKRRVETNI